VIIERVGCATGSTSPVVSATSKNTRSGTVVMHANLRNYHSIVVTAPAVWPAWSSSAATHDNLNHVHQRTRTGWSATYRRRQPLAAGQCGQPVRQHARRALPSAGILLLPLSISGPFPVAAGSFDTFYLNRFRTQGAAGASISAFAAALGATFIPN
jgi:hypothetical protein